MNIVEHIKNIADYIHCCLFAKAGQYEAYYVRREFGTLNGMKYMNAYLYAVEFEKDEVIKDKNLPLPLGRYGNHMDMDSTNPIHYDADNDIIYVLENRLYGGKDGRSHLSLIDRRRQCSEIKKLMITLLFYMAKHRGGNETRLNIVENMEQTVKYQDILPGKVKTILPAM